MNTEQQQTGRPRFNEIHEAKIQTYQVVEILEKQQSVFKGTVQISVDSDPDKNKIVMPAVDIPALINALENAQVALEVEDRFPDTESEGEENVGEYSRVERVFEDLMVKEDGVAALELLAAINLNGAEATLTDEVLSQQTVAISILDTEDLILDEKAGSQITDIGLEVLSLYVDHLNEGENSDQTEDGEQPPEDEETEDEETEDAEGNQEGSQSQTIPLTPQQLG